MPFIILKNEEASESILLSGEMARSEILLNERFETVGSKTEMKEPRSGKISRHTQVLQNMSVDPATARVEKSEEGCKGGKALSSLARFRHQPLSNHRN